MLTSEKAKLIIVALIMTMVVGCGISDDTNNAGEQNNLKNGEETQSEEFIPSKELPAGIPVYPGAILSGEITPSEDAWQWLYQTTATGNEIVTFFVNELIELGFEIDNYGTTANREEFFISTKDEIIRVYWLDSESIAYIDDVTPNTPNRHYSIVVNLPAWENR